MSDKVEPCGICGCTDDGCNCEAVEAAHAAEMRAAAKNNPIELPAVKPEPVPQPEIPKRPEMWVWIGYQHGHWYKEASEFKTQVGYRPHYPHQFIARIPGEGEAADDAGELRKRLDQVRIDAEDSEKAWIKLVNKKDDQLADAEKRLAGLVTELRKVIPELRLAEKLQGAVGFSPLIRHIESVVVPYDALAAATAPSSTPADNSCGHEWCGNGTMKTDEVMLICRKCGERKFEPHPPTPAPPAPSTGEQCQHTSETLSCPQGPYDVCTKCGKVTA